MSLLVPTVPATNKRPRTSMSAASFPTAATAAATAVIDLYHNDNDDGNHARNTSSSSKRRRARMDSANYHGSKKNKQPVVDLVSPSNARNTISSSSSNRHRAGMDSANHHRSKRNKYAVVDLVSPTNDVYNAATAVAQMVYNLNLGDDDDRKPAASLRNQDDSLALQLQQQLYNGEDEDDDFEVYWNDCIAILAASTTTMATNTISLVDDNDHNDYEVALELHREEEMAQKLRDSQNKKNEECMKESSTGKAWKFVERVLAMVERLRAAAGDFALVTPIATDNLVFLTERTLVEQADFSYRGKPTVVDLGYHYTRTSNLTGIREGGLLSRVERSEKKIAASKENGASYGEGIYTAKDPSSFASSYGDIGLLVARLQGRNGDYTPGAGAAKTLDSWTISRNVPKEFTVLSSASLCIPILQFPSTLITSKAKGKLVLEMYHRNLLGIVQEFFNQDASTNRSINEDLAAVQLGGPSTRNNEVQLAGPATPIRAQHTAGAVMHAPPPRLPKQNCHRPLTGGGTSSIPVQPIWFATAIVNESIHYTARETMGLSSEGDLWYACKANDLKPNNICTICLDPMLEQCSTSKASVVALHKCGHQFHLGCIQQALGHGRNCPTCRHPLQNPQGTMPSGTMTVQRQESIVCAGFESAGSIVIQYSIPSSAQKLYHPHPGVKHGRAHRVTYIPDVPAGLDLLKRLKFAFRHGLTFTVGVSMASGQDNSVTWASIHHKTSYYGGTRCHGFPDPGFFVNCNEEMDALFVPSADNL